MGALGQLRGSGVVLGRAGAAQRPGAVEGGEGVEQRTAVAHEPHRVLDVPPGGLGVARDRGAHGEVAVDGPVAVRADAFDGAGACHGKELGVRHRAELPVVDERRRRLELREPADPLAVAGQDVEGRGRHAGEVGTGAVHVAEPAGHVRVGQREVLGQGVGHQRDHRLHPRLGRLSVAELDAGDEAHDVAEHRAVLAAALRTDGHRVVGVATGGVQLAAADGTGGAPQRRVPGVERVTEGRRGALVEHDLTVDVVELEALEGRHHPEAAAEQLERQVALAHGEVHDLLRRGHALGDVLGTGERMTVDGIATLADGTKCHGTANLTGSLTGED